MITFDEWWNEVGSKLRGFSRDSDEVKAVAKAAWEECSQEYEDRIEDYRRERSLMD